MTDDRISRREFWQKAEKYHRVFLHPGEVFILDRPTLVHTVLGSCVSIILYSIDMRISSISHARLPEIRNSKMKCSEHCPVKCRDESHQSNNLEYVTCSFEYMLREFHRRSISDERVMVKMFGGASIYKYSVGSKSVGSYNTETAIKLSGERRFNSVKKRFGGTSGIELYLFSDTGEVLISKV